MARVWVSFKMLGAFSAILPLLRREPPVQEHDACSSSECFISVESRHLDPCQKPRTIACCPGLIGCRMRVCFRCHSKWLGPSGVIFGCPPLDHLHLSL